MAERRGSLTAGLALGDSDTEDYEDAEECLKEANESIGINASSVKLDCGVETWTAEEIRAIRATERVIFERDNSTLIEPRVLCAACLIGKLRPDTSADKYISWLNLLHDDFGITLEDVFSNLDATDTWEELRPLLENFRACGKDEMGRSIFWIRGNGGVSVADESRSIRAGMLYWLAVHADWVSLRNGISFVVDTGGNSSNIGNEKKMQKANQSFPLRPQRIMILGTNFVQRVIINALIRFASLFAKDKVIDRITFSTIDDVIACMPLESLPSYVGGNGAGVDVVEWTRSRVAQFPAVPEGLMKLGDTSESKAQM
jgi:hypothetical protein